MPAAETIAAFARAVVEPSAPPPSELRGTRGDLASRFSVHRNNVAVARLDAMAAQFPVSRRLIGDAAFFAAMRVYLRECPPTSPIVASWGDDLPGFLAAHPPTRADGALIDTARLEAAWTRAYHGAEAEPIGLDRPIGRAAEELAAARARLHPTFALIASAHPIGAIRAALAEGEAAPAGPAETVMVVRPREEVIAAVLDPAEAAFVAALAAGATIAEASDAALALDAGTDVGARLVALLLLGAIVDLA